MTRRTHSDRRRLRALAMQFLFQCDAQGQRALPDAGLESFLAQGGLRDADVEFVRVRVEAALQRWDDIDREISAASRNWELGRIAVPDRAVLRLAVVEMLHVEDTPPKVAIDEAIELARTYGSKESPQFVNGVLDAIFWKHHNPESLEE